MNIEKAKELLTNSGYRKTAERFKILEAMFELMHFTPNELLDKCKEYNFRLSNATAYNSIDVFIELGVVALSKQRKLGMNRYKISESNALRETVEGLNYTVKIDIIEVIESNMDSKARAELIKGLYNSIPRSDINDFVKCVLNDYKKSEVESSNKEEVVKAFDIVINSIN